MARLPSYSSPWVELGIVCAFVCVCVSERETGCKGDEERARGEHTFRRRRVATAVGG